MVQGITGGVVAMHCPRQGTPRVHFEVGVQVPIGLHGLLYPIIQAVGQPVGAAVMVGVLLALAMAKGTIAARLRSANLYMVVEWCF